MQVLGMTFEELKNSIENANLTPYGLNQIMSFVNGNVQVKSNGNLKLSIEFPAEILKKKSVPFTLKDFNIVPLILFCKHKEE